MSDAPTHADRLQQALALQGRLAAMIEALTLDQRVQMSELQSALNLATGQLVGAYDLETETGPVMDRVRDVREKFRALESFLFRQLLAHESIEVLPPLH